MRRFNTPHSTQVSSRSGKIISRRFWLPSVKAQTKNGDPALPSIMYAVLSMSFNYCSCNLVCISGILVTSTIMVMIVSSNVVASVAAHANLRFENPHLFTTTTFNYSKYGVVCSVEIHMIVRMWSVVQCSEYVCECLGPSSTCV